MSNRTPTPAHIEHDLARSAHRYPEAHAPRLGSRATDLTPADIARARQQAERAEFDSHRARDLARMRRVDVGLVHYPTRGTTAARMVWGTCAMGFAIGVAWGVAIAYSYLVAHGILQ